MRYMWPCQTVLWPSKSGQSQATVSVPTVVFQSQNGLPSTCVWWFATNVQVCLCQFALGCFDLWWYFSTCLICFSFQGSIEDWVLASLRFVVWRWTEKSGQKNLLRYIYSIYSILCKMCRFAAYTCIVTCASYPPLNLTYDSGVPVHWQWASK